MNRIAFTIRACFIGGRAALSTPYWLHAGRLATLRSSDGLAPLAAPAAGSALAVRVAIGLVQRLSRVPLSPWKDTCLFRSVAECLALRGSAIPARLVIGVRNSQPPFGAIEAHAWVSRGEGEGAHSQYQPLSGSVTAVSGRR